MITSKGLDWLRSDPPEGKHTHIIKGGIDVSLMARVLRQDWKYYYRIYERMYCTDDYKSRILLMEGGWNDVNKGP